jgi:hypothetical protein
MEASSTRKLIHLAKNCCCNYSEVGPFRKKHYCAFEPRQTGGECFLFHQIPCKYFRDALLPTKPELRREWELLLKQMAPEFELTPQVDAMLKQCACGVTFTPRSNRQTSCLTCSNKSAKIHNRERSQRYRQKMLASTG